MSLTCCSAINVLCWCNACILYRRFPSSSCVCPYDMVLIILMFMMHSDIHVYCLIYVTHKQMLDY